LLKKVFKLTQFEVVKNPTYWVFHSLKDSFCEQIGPLNEIKPKPGRDFKNGVLKQEQSQQKELFF